MAFSLADIKTKATLKPPRILIHGKPGVGKTTIASEFPEPIFLMTEDGLGVIDVAHTDLLKNYDDIIEILKSLLAGDHKYKTLVIDSLDHLEPIIFDKTCKVEGFKDINEPGYGKGFSLSLKYTREIIDLLNQLREQKGMIICMLAHSVIKRFEDPTSEAYDRYEIKLNAKHGFLYLEVSDIVGFADFKTGTVVEKSRGGERTRAVSTGQRVLHVEERPAFLAKNRYSLPAELPLKWDAIKKAIKNN